MTEIFKIGEFSKLTQISVRMLRYYDETGLLKPAVTDDFTNYRLYSTEQIPTLNRIIFLRDLGFHVTEIADALRNWDDDYIIGQLERRQIEIEGAITAEQERLSKIALAKKDIKRKNADIHFNVSIKSIPACQVLSLRRTVDNYYCEGGLCMEMADFAAKNKIRFTGSNFTIYHDPDYRETDIDMELCAPVSISGKNSGGFGYRLTEAEPLMACTMVYGPFENIDASYHAFAGWLQDHDRYRMKGPTRQLVHRGPWNERQSSQYLTEIQIPLEYRKKSVL